MKFLSFFFLFLPMIRCIIGIDEWFPKKYVANYHLYPPNYDFKPNDNVCVKCMLCWAVAKEISKAFRSYRRKYPKLNMIRENKLVSYLNNECQTRFKQFALRKYDDYLYLIEPKKDTILISTSMDKLWSKNLTEMCRLFLQVYGEYFLYKMWFDNDYTDNNQMITYLCRKDSLFRYCNNLPDESLLKRPNKTC